MVTNIESIDFNLAIVLGLGITGLGVIRNLGRNGISILGVDSDPLAVALFSKYCTKKLIYKKTEAMENFLENLKSLAEKINKKCVLIPTDDKYVRFICKFRKNLV